MKYGYYIHQYINLTINYTAIEIRILLTKVPVNSKIRSFGFFATIKPH